MLTTTILETASEEGWNLQAWAVFPNHYHVIGFSPQKELAVNALTRRIHGRSAQRLNRVDLAAGRKVWFRSWDTRLNFEKSYLARLAYVHNNPVKHGLVKVASDYQWCSAAWFLREGDPAFVRTVLRLKTDKVTVIDDF